MWVWILAGLAVLVILFYSRPRENMTNEQLIATLRDFGDKGTPAPPQKGTKEIYGPQGKPPAFPTNMGGKSGKSVGGPYPYIFGPDTNVAPGTSGSGGDMYGSDFGYNSSSGVAVAPGTNAGTAPGTGLNPTRAGEVASDQSSSNPALNDKPTYEFNVNLKKAFPYDGPPQPFLTDFSKIQH